MAGIRTPQDVRGTFARNLRQLAAGERSVSALCREAGINRTQFNRYLSGEAHPRPDVLDRICRRFGLDARILLEPLEDLRRGSPPPGATLDLEPFGDRIQGFDHRRMPDGFYRLVRPAMTTRGMALASLLVLRSAADGTKRALAAVPAYYFAGTVRPRPWRERRLASVVFQHSNGVSLLLGARAGNLVQMCFLAPGHRAVATLFSGYTAFTQPADATQAQAVPVLAEYVGPRCADALRVRRTCGTIAWPDLRPVERDWFETWNPFGPHRPGPGE
jgi:AcrR family transcriptional regulator